MGKGGRGGERKEAKEKVKIKKKEGERKEEKKEGRTEKIQVTRNTNMIHTFSLHFYPGPQLLRTLSSSKQ